MRIELSNYLDECIAHLRTVFKEDEDTLLLVNAFITQYEIRSVHQLQKSFLKKLEEKAKITYGRFRQGNTGDKSIALKNEIPQLTDMIFWPFQKMHLDVGGDIYRNLQEKNELNVKIFSHNSPIIELIEDQKFDGHIELKTKGFPLYDYTKDPKCKKILKAAKQLPKFQHKNYSISFNEIISNVWFLWYGLYAYTVATYKKIIKTYQPKAFFVGNDLTVVGNIVCRLAQKDGIQTFSIMHGSIKNPFWKYSVVDNFFLFGKKDKELMIKRGIQAEKLLISGSPKVEKRLKNLDQEAFNYPHKDFVLVALSGPGHSITEEHHIQVLDILEQLAQEFPQLHFTFKLHKKDKNHYYEQLRQLENVNIISYGDKKYSSNIYNWLNHAKILVTGASTSAVDAMLFNIPVVTIDLMQHLTDVDFISKKVTLHAVDYSSLKKHFQRIVAQDDLLANHLEISRHFVQRAFTQLDEGSVPFIVRTITEKIKNEA